MRWIGIWLFMAAAGVVIALWSLGGLPPVMYGQVGTTNEEWEWVLGIGWLMVFCLSPRIAFLILWKTVVVCLGAIAILMVQGAIKDAIKESEVKS